MTRVDENREAQRAAEARKAADIDKAKRQGNADNFKKLVGGQQQGAQQTAKKQMQQSASNALLARNGIQSRNFSQALLGQGEQAVDKSGVDNKQRRSEVNERELSTQQDQANMDDASMRTQDPLAPISRDDGQGGQGGMGGGSDGMGNDSSGEPGGNQEGMDAQGLANAMNAGQADEAQGAHAPRMSQEVLQQLVNRVFAGVTPEGLSQFTVELRGDVLGGARLDVVAKDGKISCTFHTNDKNVANLLKASEGQLARAFGHKGLTLERLAVNQG